MNVPAPASVATHRVAFWSGVVSPVVLILGLAVVVGPGLVARAYTLRTLWSWYAVDAGLPAISTSTAFGACLLATVLLPPRRFVRTDPGLQYPLWARVAMPVVGCALVLALGWVGRAFE